MPRRPDEHVIADQAVAAVMDQVAQAGYAAEVVSKDYGEDLLVQTSHAGRMDASRLWLQVKGTADCSRYLKQSGDLRLSVSFDHALRWSRSADLVAVVLWDVQAGAGWFALPLGQVDPMEGFLAERQTMTLQFYKEDVFIPRVVEWLAWESRIEHFRHLMLSARSIDAERREHGEEETKLVGLLALDLLKLMGMVEQTSDRPVLFALADPVRRVFVDFFVIVSAREEDVEAAVYEAAMRTLFEFVPQRNGHRGLPRVLIEELTEALLTLLGLPPLLEEARCRAARHAG